MGRNNKRANVEGIKEVVEVKPQIIEPETQSLNLVDSLLKEISLMIESAQQNELEKTTAHYERCMKTIESAKKQLLKTEKFKIKEQEQKDKPRKQRAEPYKKEMVGTIEINGKMKDKYEITKVENGPVIIKYRVHQPTGLTKDQFDFVEQKLNELKQGVRDKGSDFNDAQLKKAINIQLNMSK